MGGGFRKDICGSMGRNMKPILCNRADIINKESYQLTKSSLLGKSTEGVNSVWFAIVGNAVASLHCNESASQWIVYQSFKTDS